MPDRDRFWGDDRPAYVPPPRKDVRTPDDDGGCWPLLMIIVIGVAAGLCALGGYVV